MNCQSIKNKKPELQTIVDTAKPDIILVCDSWLTPDITNWEIFPEGFDAVRKDRVGDAHGGVCVCFKKDLICTEVPNLIRTVTCFGSIRSYPFQYHRPNA